MGLKPVSETPYTFTLDGASPSITAVNFVDIIDNSGDTTDASSDRSFVPGGTSAEGNLTNLMFSLIYDEDNLASIDAYYGDGLGDCSGDSVSVNLSNPSTGLSDTFIFTDSGNTGASYNINLLLPMMLEIQPAKPD